MTDLPNICLPCGACCDGTLIGFVQLDRHEVPAIKQLMDIEDENGNGIILGPCKSYCDGCTIYSKRPKQCGIFKCDLLKSFERKEVDFDSAIEIITEIKHKRSVMEEKLAILKLELKSQSFYFKMVELKKLLQKRKSESALTENQLELISDIKEFDKLLSKKMGLSFD